jgi:hypothetical protein
MGEVSVNNALDSLSSDKAKDRTDGLAGMDIGPGSSGFRVAFSD